MVFDAPGKGDGIQLEIRSDSKTVVDWINGMAKQRSAGKVIGDSPRTTQKKGGRLGGAHHNRLMPGPKKELEA